MYLRLKDKVLLATMMLLLSGGSIAMWLLIHQAALLISLIAGTFVIVTIQMESYRRVQNGLKQINEVYAQIEALFYLFSTIKFRHPLPPMRGWAISPDFANIVASLIRKHQPRLVLEAGSGVSTLVAAYCLQETDLGRVVSLDHDEHYAQISAANMLKHQLQDTATVIYAPLKEVTIRGETWLWYDMQKLGELGPVDMLIIDGPPGGIQKMARYPALPLLFDLLSDEAVILLDDALRSDEREIIKSWLKEFPDFSIEEVNTEKGTVILHRQQVDSERAYEKRTVSWREDILRKG